MFSVKVSACSGILSISIILFCGGRKCASPPLTTISVCKVWGFFAGMSIYNISTSQAVYKSLTVGRENEVSHLGERDRIQKSALRQTEQD